MSKQHDQGHHHHDGNAHSAEESIIKGLRSNWLAWLAVGLMLLAMLVYVLTINEAVEPEIEAGPQFPAAAE